jgi:HD-GYP domain-containing protein (c-di-GMP phosphodiesterase class II)
MNTRKKNELTLEIFLIIIALALSGLFHLTAGYKMTVLNLFFLPVVLAGFFLGRYRASTLALLCVVVTSAAAVVDLNGFAAYNSPVIIALSVATWGAVLGLTAILVGTLSDERDQKTAELHDAYVGVVEVLSKYLQGANSKTEVRSNRIAELSQRIGRRMHLSAREVDNIRMAALLHDLENIKITSQVIQKAVSDIETGGDGTEEHTFHGCDLARSLGSVLTGALPLLLGQDDSLQSGLLDEETSQSAALPIGAEIIRTVRAYDALRQGGWGQLGQNPLAAIDELLTDDHSDFDPKVIQALTAEVPRGGKTEEADPVNIS